MYLCNHLCNHDDCTNIGTRDCEYTVLEIFPTERKKLQIFQAFFTNSWLLNLFKHTSPFKATKNVKLNSPSSKVT